MPILKKKTAFEGSRTSAIANIIFTREQKAHESNLFISGKHKIF
jgi:hypothetical protein